MSRMISSTRGSTGAGAGRRREPRLGRKARSISRKPPLVRSAHRTGAWSLHSRNAKRSATLGAMRRFRFFVFLLALTLVPQLVAASHLANFLSAQPEAAWRALSAWIAPLVLLANIPLVVELVRRQRQRTFPRWLAGALQVPW